MVYAVGGFFILERIMGGLVCGSDFDDIQKTRKRKLIDDAIKSTGAWPVENHQFMWVILNTDDFFTTKNQAFGGFSVAKYVCTKAMFNERAAELAALDRNYSESEEKPATFKSANRYGDSWLAAEECKCDNKTPSTKE